MILTKTQTLLLSAAMFAATPVIAQTSTAPTTTPPVGAAPAPTGAPIPVTPMPAPTTTVAQMLQASPDHATLLKLVTAANLGSALSGPGPITVFAPDDAAFSRLAPGTVDKLMEPANVGSATQILKYHVVPGHYTTDDLLKQLKTTPTLTLTTLDGQPLTLTLVGQSAIQLTDAIGGKASIAKTSDDASNGVIEYINGVLSPKMVAQPPAATDGAATTTPPTTSDTTGADTSDQDDASGS
ncbi:fasciclin domain-containing protein [Sphingomonas koreensis]|nr:fasciclin domain-containing protein [Sphingomonas koreensis]